MRLARYTVAGVLLLSSALALTALLAQPALVAVAIFIPLWYAIAAVNAYLGVTSAGYPVRDEALVFVPTFGVPAVIAGAIGWVYRDGGPVAHGGRWVVVLVLFVAGLALWAAMVVLIGLLAGLPTVGAGLGPAFMFFAPLWVLVCVVELAAGDGFWGELAILLLNVVVALLAWRLTARRAIRVQRVSTGDAGRLG